ncbi:tetraspanin-4-like [Lingula anatina]|uniref:Tetraspanin n=1 Tax=Lingula anatina TaxID=7574 RepID=A0A1S3IGQ4_LINAN|nr:tetraspanin-4 [Lingula anatina]XP_013396654.1 tetraspanin-4 [Lingula anatina]XP_013417211.1 tetraspanin-4-like [Lingula anatina]|eukprot:XP_013396652.1 tetraspanin-4 [Lingula anatina]
MGSGFLVIKYVFYGFNCLFWLLGCASLGVGVWLHQNKGEYGAIAQSYSFLSAPALLIAAGVVILVVGFFGCCGALAENQCMLLTYFVLVVLIFVLQIVAAILAFVHQDEINHVLENELLVGIKDKYPGDPRRLEMKDAWDLVQIELGCCGVYNYSDWFKSHAWPDKDWVPDSCCRASQHSTLCGRTGNPAMWQSHGCFNELKYWLTQHLYILGVVAITVGVIQILGMVAAMVLYCCLRNNKYYR